MKHTGVRIHCKKNAILILDQEGKILCANSTAELMSGYKAKEFLGKSLQEFIPDPRGKKKVMAMIKKAIARKALTTAESRFRRKDQKKFFAEMILFPFRGAAGKGTRCQCLLRDITRQQEADKHLKEARGMRAQFTATVSHELRTPLSVMKEIVAMLLAGEGGALEEQQRRFLDMARSNIERLEKLILETLDLRALEEGRKAFYIRENSLGEIFAEIERVKKAVAEKKGHRLIVRADPKLPRVNFDREQILECFKILLDFSIRRGEKKDIILEASRKGNMLHMSVCDSFSKKPCRDLSRLFLPLEPFNAEEKIKLGRTGMEFARTKEIVAKHHGKIWAEFLPGKGTFFHILLPIWERRSS